MHTLLQQVEVHQLGGEQLALGENLLLFEFSETVAGERAQQREHCVDFAVGLHSEIHIAEEHRHYAAVVALQLVDDFFGAVDVVLIEIFADFYKGVGGAGHSGKHHDVAASGRDEFGHVADSLGRADRSAAEFQNFHLSEEMFCGACEALQSMSCLFSHRSTLAGFCSTSCIL